MNVTNSEIATLLRDAANRLEVAPEPDQPKPRYRRRWSLMGGLQGLAPGEHVTVIEVWPGDPTPEQAEALAKAARCYLSHAEVGPLHKALAPFRKP